MTLQSYLTLKMPGPDAYYTPDGLATRLLNFVVGKPRTAVDFCVGDGGLLKATKHRFEDIACHGIDISEDVIDRLAIREPSWHLGQCDFRDAEALAKIPFLLGATFDLIVMNPPFTCRGSSIEKVTIGDEEYHVSTAMSFLLGALSFLSETGAIYAILPVGCVYSQKDRKCWEYLKNYYHACVLSEVQKAYFNNKCAPNIVLVYLGRKPYPHEEVKIGQAEAQTMVELQGISRGQLGVNEMKKVKVGKKRLPYIHTTNMRKGELVDVSFTREGLKKSVKGNGVLIPRVCNPNLEKIVVYDGKEAILSDCVILLHTRTKEEAVQLKRYLVKNWEEFNKNYVGTGARYVTIERLRKYFHCQE